MPIRRLLFVRPQGRSRLATLHAILSLLALGLVALLVISFAPARELAAFASDAGIPAAASASPSAPASASASRSSVTPLPSVAPGPAHRKTWM